MEPEIDPNFEPQSRLRANTWPARPRDFFEDEGNKTPNSTVSENDKHDEPHECVVPVAPGDDGGANAEVSSSTQKKGSARRNAWGNLSYADLITKAINSSPEKRLTLSQIYDWMVQNVPYFRDKGDSNSSAGWKNSIRHNLSLHSRFVRVQNEGTGKSSWWIVNADAKNSKAPRRRVASMDTKAMKEKRVRAKRKVDQIRALQGQNYGGSSSDINNGYGLSPAGDYRQRTSSNASSIGRLSPTQFLESGLDPHSLSPGNWQEMVDYNNPAAFPDTITESFAEMLVNSQGLADELSGLGMVSPNAVQPQQISQNAVYNPQGLSFLQQLNGMETSLGNSQPTNNGYPGSYTSQAAQTSQNQHLLQMHQLQQQMQQQQQQPHLQPSRRPLNVPQTLSELLEQTDAGEDEKPNPQVLSHSPHQQQHINLPRYNDPSTQTVVSGIKSEPVTDLPKGQPHSTGNVAAAQPLPKEKPNVFRSLTDEQRNQLTTSLLRQVLTDQMELQAQLSGGLQKNLKQSDSMSTASVGQQTSQPPQQPMQANRANVLYAELTRNNALVAQGNRPMNGHDLGTHTSGGQMISAGPAPQIKIEPDNYVPDDLQNLDFSSLPELKTEGDDLEQFLNQDFSLADPMDFNFDAMQGTLQATESQGFDLNKYQGF